MTDLKFNFTLKNKTICSQKLSLRRVLYNSKQTFSLTIFSFYQKYYCS